MLNYKVDFANKMLSIHEKQTWAAMAEIKKVTDLLEIGWFSCSVSRILGSKRALYINTQRILLVEKKLESISYSEISILNFFDCLNSVH